VVVVEVVEVVEVVVGVVVVGVVVEVVEIAASVDVVGAVTVDGDEVDVAGATSAGLDWTAALHAVATTSATVAAARPSIMLPDGSGNPRRPDLTQITSCDWSVSRQANCDRSSRGSSAE